MAATLFCRWADNRRCSSNDFLDRVSHLPRVRITTLAASGNIQLAIYANNSTTNRPTGSQLAATGNIVTDVATYLSTDITGADVALTPGVYWAAVNSDNATVVCQVNSTTQTVAAYTVGVATATNGTSATATAGWLLTTPLTFGTWGDLTGATFTETTGVANALLWLKVAMMLFPANDNEADPVRMAA